MSKCDHKKSFTGLLYMVSKQLSKSKTFISTAYLMLCTVQCCRVCGFQTNTETEHYKRKHITQETLINVKQDITRSNTHNTQF